MATEVQRRTTAAAQQAVSPLPIAATFSKDPRFFGRDFYPTELTGGTGAYCVDAERHTWLDWISALGAITLGYGDQYFVSRVTHAVRAGVGFSLPHMLERQVADKLALMLGPRVPGWQGRDLGVRFGLSGTDACSTAVRLARAATGRTRVLMQGYHGFQDWSVAATPPAWGVVGKGPRYVEEFRWGAMPDESAGDATGDSAPDQWPADSPHGPALPSLAACFARDPRVAAVIVEMPPEDPPAGWFDHLRGLCDRHGALLILDEVVTSPRYALGGVAERYGARPDLVCLGKGWGNGVPFSAVVGTRELFDWFDPDARPNHDPCFISSTGFGNAVSLAAASAVLDLWDDGAVQQVWQTGGALIQGLRAAGYRVIGHPPRSLLQFDSPAERAFFIREMANRGILINRPNLPNLAHTDHDVAKTVEAAAEVKRAAQGVDVEGLMAGKLPLVLFEKR